MSQMIQITLGEYGTQIALPYASDEAMAVLLRTPCFVRDYLRGPNDEYNYVYVRKPVSVSIAEVEVFDGTAEEYRNQPPTPATRADLVVQLSAANDQIAALEDTVRSLNSQLSDGPDVLREAAE